MKLDFYMPVKVISGENCVRSGGSVFASLGKKCLIVTGKRSAKLCGALDDCAAVLQEQGIAYQVFDGVGQNPLLSVCEEAGRAARTFGAEFLIGIGGGSPLDATKAVAFFAAQDLEDEDLFGTLPPIALPMVLIGTTAGTGSEVTPYSILTVDATGRKCTFVHPSGLTYAKYAFSDPKYTASLPYDFTVSTALDALCHAIEGFFSSRSNDYSSMCAVRATSLLAQAMADLREGAEISPEQRERLLYGSVYAGITISITGTGFCHPLGYFLSEQYDAPHGQACALYLCDYLSEAKTNCPALYASFLDQLRLEDGVLQSLISRLLSIKLPALTEDELHDIAHRCASTGNFVNSPGPFTEEKAFALLMRIYR